MATFNSSSNVLNSCVKSTGSVQTTAAFSVPSPSPLVGLHAPSFASTSSAVENHSYLGIQQKNIPSLTHHHVNSLSSFTFMEIKREPCQVSEVTTSNNLHTNHNSKSMSSTTTTLVKIESTSPKVSDMDKSVTEIHTNNSMQVGVALTRKKPQDSTPVHSPRDMNYFGIRVADIGGVTAGACGNIYFAGTDLIPGASNEDMNSIHNESRSSTFWQYPNAFPLESVISMSPVGLQYARDPGRGQLVLLPTTSSIESFPQAAFLWPSYMQQNPSAMQTTPNFVFPSMSPQTSALPPTYAAPLQFLGPNYLTTATASSTVCHHSQATGSSFLSISSDTRRTEQSQKHYVMKMEDLFQHNSLNKGNLTSNFEDNSKIDKSKNEESNYSLTNVNLVGPATLMQNEQSHILMNSTHSPSELITIPMIPANYTIPPNMAPVSPPQMGEVGAIYKNSALRVSGFSKTPEMQDVNIQTDTPACSEDENSNLEFASIESNSCNLQSFEKIKSISTQCHNNCVGCKTTLSKENSIDSLPQCTGAYDFSKPNSCLAFPETYVYDNDCVSNRSADNSYNMESIAVIPCAELNIGSSTFKPTSNPAPLLEMSGLELLSNISTGSFVNPDSLKAVRIKQELCENIENEHTNDSLKNYETYSTNSNTLEISYADPKEKNPINDSIKTPTPTGEPSLGGLNLLCALAEQRIQEEVANNNLSNLAKKPILEAKKRKHKHSKSKCYRQSRYYKEKNKKKISKDRKKSDLKSDCDDVHDNLRSAFKKVDPDYKKLNKWPDPEDFFKAMESDMRMRLADITRQYRKKKRKLDEINKIKKRKKNSEYKFANISCKNPSFICFLDKFQSTSSNFPPSADEIEQKSLNTQNMNIVDSMVDTNKKNEDTSVVFGEGTSSINLNTQKPSENLIFSEIKRHKNKKYKIKHIPTFKVDRSTSESGSLITKCQQQVQQTKQKQQTQLLQAQQQQDTVIKEENKIALKIDKEIVLSNEHLYRKETRVLTDMGGLFYAGILKPLQPPDVYAITLDGERGNKSHIMSREEIFKDAILEVVPKTIKNVPTGTRLCAYWSQQYRCLYPGKAIDSDNTDMGSDFVSVEFDDGDSGRIHLQNIRFLLSDYPIVEYNENPFNNLGKNKKGSCTKITLTSNDLNGGTILDSVVQETDENPLKSRIDKTKNQFHKIASHLSNLSGCVPKHTKHRKKKKHKKHHRKSSAKNAIIVINEEHNEENSKLTELKSNQQAEIINEINTAKNTDLDKTNSKLLVNNVKHEINGLEDEDSNSNVVSETSDEARNERIDYNSGKGSKIAAFLPERQLWGWLGQAYRKAGLKGRARKKFYKSITRGKETITVGECAVFLSTGRPDRPYIGRIEAMWETTSSNKIVRVRWFYHPEETTGCRTLKYPGALFDSPHEDENDVQTISHRCEVIKFSVYIAKFGSDSAQYQSINDNNDTYYLSGYYNPRLQVLKMQPDIPTLDDTSL